MSQFRACLVEDTFVAAREAAVDVDSLELIGAPRHVVLCVRWPEIVESEWEFGRITRIGDFVEREAALAAAGLGEDRGLSAVLPARPLVAWAGAISRRRA